VTTRVVVEDRFDELGLLFDNAMRRALAKAASVTRAEAARLAPKGETGRLANSMHLSEIEPLLGGYRINVFAGMFYGKFLEFGTLGERRKKLRRPDARQRISEPGQGIEPRYFMRRAGRNTEEALDLAVVEELRSL
jgi:HK97 gp10 family phage protein